MRPRIPARRVLTLRPFRPPNSPRPFTQNTLRSRRPQLPFLASPTRRPIVRFLTTQRKTYLKQQVLLAGKYTTILWTTTVLGLLVAFGVQQEYLERRFPSPHEWSWVTRKDYRSARWNEDHENDGTILIDWARTGEAYRRLIARLEDPKKDGAGLSEQEDGGILVEGIGKTGFDVSSKPEPWRRGYHEILMGAARAAEHLDSWVRDKTRNTAFPGDTVIGPSNPDPRPVPPGAASPPREEDCEPAFDRPEVYYMRILTTKGFDERQRLDAALAYANWLDFKGTPDAALEMYNWALDIATSTPDAEKVVEKRTGAIKGDAGPVPANVLRASTAVAVHHAVNGNTATALPIFLSVLRARRTLSDEEPTMLSTLAEDEDRSGFLTNLWSLVRSAIVPPLYPAPPPSGTEPPKRNAKEKCEEAAIMSYVGEILFASSTAAKSREDGLAWTREAVDIAEEELRGRSITQEAKKSCKACLEVGLGNWAKMVTRLSREERENKNSKSVGGWFGIGSSQPVEAVGRWEAEEQVVKERVRRAREVLGSPLIGPGGGGTFIYSDKV
jgi:hypothetical protein